MSRPQPKGLHVAVLSFLGKDGKRKDIAVRVSVCPEKIRGLVTKALEQGGKATLGGGAILVETSEDPTAFDPEPYQGKPRGRPPKASRAVCVACQCNHVPWCRCVNLPAAQRMHVYEPPPKPAKKGEST